MLILMITLQNGNDIIIPFYSSGKYLIKITIIALITIIIFWKPNRATLYTLSVPILRQQLPGT